MVILWNRETFQRVGSASGRGVLMLTFRDRQTNTMWTIINIYGMQDVQDQKVQWQTIQAIRPAYLEDLWLVGRDFSTKMFVNEQEGGLSNG